MALAEQIAVKLWRLGRVVRHEADLVAISQDPDLAFILGVWDRLTDECKRRLLEITKVNLPHRVEKTGSASPFFNGQKMGTGDRLLSVQASRLVAKVTALKCRF